MNVQDAVKKGFLNLTEDELDDIFNQLYDIESERELLDAGVELLKTVVAEEKIWDVVDLASLVAQARDDMEAMGEDEEEFEDEEDFEAGNGAREKD